MIETLVVKGLNSLSIRSNRLRKSFTRAQNPLSYAQLQKDVFKH